jgi:hypothetical protein
LKFVGYFRGAMVQTTTCNHNIGSQQQCNKNLQRKSSYVIKLTKLTNFLQSSL